MFKTTTDFKKLPQCSIGKSVRTIRIFRIEDLSKVFFYVTMTHQGNLHKIKKEIHNFFEWNTYPKLIV